jgi:hypothetical protein
MYGANVYGGFTYGAEQTDAGAEGALQIVAPVISNAFTVYPPAVHSDAGIAVPLVTSSMQIFPPSSVEAHGRPLAEDIRIMRVRRSE